MSLEDKIKNAEETMWPMTMGTSIDEAILTIKNAIRFTHDEVYEEAFAVAIETMHKYQKIEELMRGWNNFNAYERMWDIYEVIEDGNDD